MTNYVIIQLKSVKKHDFGGIMEGYIKKINDRVIKNNSEDKQKRIKKRFLVSGGLTLGLGLAGFVSAFIAFIVLFLQFETDRALITWFVAIPFVIMIVIGSVLTRIGDMLLRPEGNVAENTQASSDNKDEKEIQG